MKKVITGDELKEKMSIAIDLLCNTVKTTLGPTGSNVIIDHSSFSPFITNDGATIASNIESEDEAINTILTIAKESSIKTNEDVGDGTTTTLVLLQCIFDEGIKLIESGINPITLKKELLSDLDSIISLIKKYSFKPTKKDLDNIAITSCNDEILGKLVSDVYYKTKNKDAIKVKEIEENKIFINYLKGYSIETRLASPYYLNNGNIEYTNPYLLLINDDVNNIDDLINIINFIISNKEQLIIIANSYSNDVINELVSLYLNDNINIVLLKTPEYGTRSFEILKDLSIIYDTNIVTNNITLNDIKRINNIKINKELTTFTFNKNNNIDKRIKEIKEKTNSNELDESFNNKRIFMLDNVIAEINIGSNTTTELREIKMRLEDALCALESTKEGICLGSGIIFHKISNELDNITLSNEIYIKALQEPFKQILYNAGIDYKDILINIKNDNYKTIYNAKTNKYVKNNYSVLDSTNILIKSLTNAVSIASMLLTTTSLIINEYKEQNLINQNIEI